MITKKCLSLALITVSVGLFLLSIISPLIPVAKAATIPVDNPNTNFSWQDSNTIYDSATKKSYTDYKDDKEHTYVSVSGSKICKASKASTYGNSANMTKPSFGDKPNNVDYFIDFENFDDKSKAVLYKVEVDTASTNSTADPICIATKQYDIAIASTSTQSNPFEYTSATNITGKDFIDLNMTILAQDDARLTKINQNGKYVYVDDTASDCQSYLVLGESGGKVTPDSGTLYRFYTDPSTDKCMEGGIKYINGGGPGLANTQEYPKTSTVSINNSNLFNEKTAKNPGDKAAPAAGTVDNTTPESTGAEEGDGCDNALSPWGWVMCPIIGLAENFYEWFITEIAQNYLHVGAESFSDSGLKTAWGNFVKIANTTIVLIALIMIISQIFSLEIFSAYTVKKVLPRLVIGAIAIQLSWFLTTTFSQIINAIGDGIYWLVMQPFWSNIGKPSGNIVELSAIFDPLGTSSTSSEAGNVAGTVFGIGVAALGITAAFSTGIWLTLILTVIGAIISLVVAVFTIVLRQAILIILLVISPIAIAMWILPGTNRFWKMWSDNFLKLLLMYPLIMLLVAASTIGAYILAHSGGNFSRILAMIIYFAPLFLIGATFKMAGSAMAFVGSSVNKLGDKAKGSSMFGLRDRAKENREYSDWNLSKKAKMQERRVGAERRFADTLGRDNAYGRFVRWKAGGDQAERIMSRTRMQQIQEKAEDIEKMVGGDFTRLNAIARGTATGKEAVFNNDPYARAAAFTLSAKMGKAGVSEFSAIGTAFANDDQLRNKLIGDSAFASKQAGNFTMGEVESVAGDGTIKWKGYPAGAPGVGPDTATRSAVENIIPDQLKFLGTETPPGGAPRFKDPNVRNYFGTPEGRTYARQLLDDPTSKTNLSIAQRQILEGCAPPAPATPQRINLTTGGAPASATNIRTDIANQGNATTLSSDELQQIWNHISTQGWHNSATASTDELQLSAEIYREMQNRRGRNP